MVRVADLVNELEDIAPPQLADDDDRIGLQVGSRENEVRRVCVSVDTSPPVIDLALRREASLLIAHHPLIYRPLASVAEGDPVTDRVARLIRAGAALYVAHTNYDTVPGGVNDVLAQRLGVVCCQPLTRRKEDRFYKIAVFAPEEAVEKIRDAMAEAGAGVIGLYTHCSFRTPGIGSFVPLPSAQPYIGDVGKLEEVEEYRLEMVCAGSWLEHVLAEMIDKHPYDEVAYDVYELANEPVTYGYGRVGVLESEMALGDFADRVARELEVRCPKLAGDPRRMIKRVALCGGGGSSLFGEAAKAGADVYVTGDTTHHHTLDANALGLAMIDAGHFETEKPGMVALSERLKKTFAGSGIEIEYIE